MATVQQRPTVVVTNGNTAAILGQVTLALKRCGQGEKVTEVRSRVLGADSYDQALQIMLEYADFDLDEVEERRD